MLFGVVASRFVGVPLRVGVMPSRDVSMMGSGLVAARFVVLSGMFVMLASFFVMHGCLLVRFDGFLRHERLPF